MPTTFHIQARTEHRCEPCKHHKLIGAFHVRHGPGSWVEYACLHPDAYEGLTLRGRLLFGAGRVIGRTERQPEWCPLLRLGEGKTGLIES